MLIQFSIENYRSIKENVTISFAASKDKRLETCLHYDLNKQAFLPAIALFGPNGSGKSNLVSALKMTWDMVAGKTSRASKGESLPWEPFGNSKSPTSVEWVFLYDGIRYAYGYSFDDKKIYTEYLYYWSNGLKPLFFPART